MLWDKRLLFLFILAAAKIVVSLDIASEQGSLPINEEQNNQTWILENSSQGLTGNPTYTLAASDTDTDTYTKFYIRINSTHAELHLNYTFDFENSDDTKTRNFKIVSNVGELILTLSIQDINDFTPEFTNLPATITVSEVLGVGSTLFTIEGKDDDGGESANKFSAITFAIADGNIGDAFSLDFVSQKSASLKLKSRLDYDEGLEVYNLTINATDYRQGENENNPRSAVSYLIISVTDVDDQPAVFTQNLYKVTLPESLAPGSFVIKVTAVDKDKTVKGEIEYGLVEETNPGGMFAINETTGNITLVGFLDRKTQSFYALLVSANSTYHDPMHAQVLILLDDANVHSPNFTSDIYTASVPESAEVDTLVLVVQATDSDEVNVKADLHYTTFAYNWRMQSAHNLSCTL